MYYVQYCTPVHIWDNSINTHVQYLFIQMVIHDHSFRSLSEVGGFIEGTALFIRFIVSYLHEVIVLYMYHGALDCQYLYYISLQYCIYCMQCFVFVYPWQHCLHHFILWFSLSYIHMCIYGVSADSMTSIRQLNKINQDSYIPISSW